ncbi:hypothetical protein C8Q78DRAFT_1074428 [Trametes maxima]|nr:hypothetical protein C8Q78DRAFT_1074428 [Trametes maxima]
MSSATAGLSVDAFFKSLLESFACQIIGFTIATTIYGITVLQTFMYFRKYTKDRLYLKLMVGVLYVLDTLGTILVSHSLYTYFVLNFRNPAKDIDLIWSFSLENGVTALITVLVQCYFAECLWRFSRGNKILVAAIVFCALASFGLGLETTAHLFIVKAASSLGSREVLIIGGLVQGFAALCDILITTGLCYYLQTGRSGIKSTDNLVDRLLIYAINRGALTTIVQICFLVLNVSAPGHAYFIPFHMIVSKLYVNALLATLNVRSSLAYTGNEVEVDQTSIMFNTVRPSVFEKTSSEIESKTLAQQSTSAFKPSPGNSLTHQLHTKPSNGTMTVMAV